MRPDIHFRLLGESYLFTGTDFVVDIALDFGFLLVAGSSEGVLEPEELLSESLESEVELESESDGVDEELTLPASRLEC